ncbi:MAG: hypothetical protein LIO79_05085 [Rikenellaceae bacterium]|nr:hypothetical protein [Rikenellaceae bacterium]
MKKIKIILFTISLLALGRCSKNSVSTTVENSEPLTELAGDFFAYFSTAQGYFTDDIYNNEYVNQEVYGDFTPQRDNDGEYFASGPIIELNLNNFSSFDGNWYLETRAAVQEYNSVPFQPVFYFVDLDWELNYIGLNWNNSERKYEILLFKEIEGAEFFYPVNQSVVGQKLMYKLYQEENILYFEIEGYEKIRIGSGLNVKSEGLRVNPNRIVRIYNIRLNS